VELIRVARVTTQLCLDLLECVGVEQVAQLLLAEQLAQQVAVERESLRAPFGRRRVVLVHVGRDVVEEERSRVGRGRRGLDVDEIELTGLEPGEQALQGRQVEDVLEALAVRLEHDRERAVPPCHLEQGLRLQPLLPERRALIGPPARNQECARSVLAEARAEERALADFVHDEVFELLDADQQILGRRRHVGVREMQRDAVVRPDGLHLEAERVAEPRPEREAPGRMHARSERRQDADAPVADLVAEALDDDRPVRGNNSRGSLLLAQEGEQVGGRALVEAVVARQPRDRLLTDTELDAAIHNAGETIESYYYGHDYRAADLARFFALANRDHILLTLEEEQLRGLLRQEGWLSAEAVGALISVPRAGTEKFLDAAARATLLHHDLSHGEYFTNPPYAAFTRHLWLGVMSEDARSWLPAFLARPCY